MTEREIDALLEEAERKKRERQNRELVALVALKRAQAGFAVLSSLRGLNVEEREAAQRVSAGRRELVHL